MAFTKELAQSFDLAPDMVQYASPPFDATGPVGAMYAPRVAMDSSRENAMDSSRENAMDSTYEDATLVDNGYWA
jgi:hypothetical protein